MKLETSSGDDQQRDGAWRARGVAATLGEFDPSQLLDLANEEDLASLEQLATECDEIGRDGNTRWILKPAVRTRVFGEVARGDLLDLIRETRPAGGDELGRLLQDILRDGAPNVNSLPADLGLLRTALRFVAPALGTLAADEAERQVDLQLSRQDVDQAVRVLLPRQLVGRNVELGKLRRYVAARPGVSAEDILWVTGVGGSGKSALLAELARTLRGDDWNGTPVLQVDFDRPAFYRGTLTTLMMELSRQLELHFPHMKPALSSYRRAARSGASATVSQKFSNFEAVQGREHQASSAWQREMREHLPIKNRLVLIFDTAEEVGLSSDFDLEGLRSWLRQLRTREGLPNLRVVLSGRAFSADQLALVPSSQQLPLVDLDLADAVALLQLLLESKNVSHDFPLADLVDMLGGNPLSLKILANYLAEGDEHTARDLLADRSGFDKRFAQSFLYKRILGRLRTEDQELVKLAHPGLLLRRVTPFLIQHVLAVPCDLGDLDAVRSRTLFQRLAGQVWLVQGTANPDVVFHRRDLRRLMLQAMSAEDMMRALAIHCAAADYYGQDRDPFMTREEQAVEKVYHSLFAPEASIPELDMLEAVARTLGEDLDTVPLLVRSRIKLALGRELSAAEELAMPAGDLALYRSLQSRKALKVKGQIGAGVPYSAPRLAGADDSRLRESELHAAFESGYLRVVARAAPATVAAFAQSLMLRGDRVDLQSDLTESTVWRAALSSMGRKDFVAALLKTLPDLGTRSWEVLIDGRSHSPLTAGDVYRMLFRLHGADCPADARNATWYRSSRISQTQDLRQFQLVGETAGSMVEIPVRLLRDLAADYATFFATETLQDVLSPDRTAWADLERQRDLRDHNAPMTLSALDQLGNRDGALLLRLGMALPPQAKVLLIGRLPEVHVLVRVAARACKANVLLDFAAEAARDRLWPVELGPSQLRHTLEIDRERWTATLITVVDRFGLLRGFVDWLEDRGRLKGRSLMLVRTVRDYELRLRQFIATERGVS